MGLAVLAEAGVEGPALPTSSLRSAFGRSGAATANRPRIRSAIASRSNAQSREVSTSKSFLTTSQIRVPADHQHVGCGQLRAADLGQAERGAEPLGV